ncbi:MAG: hypothetical protein GX794_02630 [Acholeplasmataceae bacterium]|jgi:hypothetical protein|nr:hypothetical protein [Acholeplasmataceae bacterium]
MAKLNLDSNIIIKGQDYLINDVVNKLIYLPAEEVVAFFTNIGLNVPRFTRINVLKNVLREPVRELRSERVTLADEVNYRLLWFNRYTEYQLENLLAFFESPSLNRLYLNEIWKELLYYMVEKQVNDSDIERLIQTAEQMPQVLPKDILSYNVSLKTVFFDEKGEIDGVKPEDFRPILYRSSTLVELRALGLKYGVDVPRRLKKDQLAQIIIDKLIERDELTPELKEEISKMSIIHIQRFAKNNDIKASIELKKEEIIEYILANATETKEAYFIPSGDNIYEQEIQEEIVEEVLIEDEVIDIAETEEVVEVSEEAPEEVIEEVVAEVPEEISEEVVDELLPIILNIAQFNSNEKYYKEDIRELKENLKQEEKENKIVKEKAADASEGGFIRFMSWMIAFVLLAIIIVVLIDLIF